MSRFLIEFSDVPAKRGLAVFAARHGLSLREAFGVVVRAGLWTLAEEIDLTPAKPHTPAMREYLRSVREHAAG